MTLPVVSSPDEYKPLLDMHGYNQVLKVGNRIDISGQGGWLIDKEEGIRFNYTSKEEEVEQAFKNVESILNSVGSSWKDVYVVKSYHIPLEKEIGGIFYKLFKKYIGDRAPLWTCIGVKELGIEGMTVEIEVTAYTNN
ncbi:unnamed protein product [Cunninghamella echinulata]